LQEFLQQPAFAARLSATQSNVHPQPIRKEASTIGPQAIAHCRNQLLKRSELCHCVSPHLTRFEQLTLKYKRAFEKESNIASAKYL
jgi:hypothetical protein